MEHNVVFEYYTCPESVVLLQSAASRTKIQNRAYLDFHMFRQRETPESSTAFDALSNISGAGPTELQTENHYVLRAHLAAVSTSAALSHTIHNLTESNHQLIATGWIVRDWMKPAMRSIPSMASDLMLSMAAARQLGSSLPALTLILVLMLIALCTIIFCSLAELNRQERPSFQISRRSPPQMRSSALPKHAPVHSPVVRPTI